MAELKARVEELTKLHGGQAPIKEKPVEAFTDVKDAKQHLITKHLKANPKDSRSTAVLAVAKNQPRTIQK